MGGNRKALKNGSNWFKFPVLTPSRSGNVESTYSLKKTFRALDKTMQCDCVRVIDFIHLSKCSDSHRYIVHY